MENFTKRLHLLRCHLHLLKQKLGRNFTRAKIDHFHCWFVLVFILLATLIYLHTWTYTIELIILPKINSRRVTHQSHTNNSASSHKGESKSKAQGESQLEEMFCNLPKLDPFDKSIIEFIESPPDIDCTLKYRKLFRTDFNNKLIQMVAFNGSCCYKILENRPDHIARFSKRCIPIFKKVTIIPSAHEFIQVNCHLLNQHNASELFRSKATSFGKSKADFTDMFAFVPPKRPSFSNQKYQTQDQTKAVKFNQSQDKSPKLNIIVLGLDGQSHMNFIRQMPSTYNYIMKNLSAIEMNGYTKVGDNTFPNVIPILTGLNVSQLMSTCWRTKYTHFDNCPFIWRNFSESAGYLTSYGENSVWMSAFQYEKRGFHRQPTDYYLNPLTLQMASKLGHSIWGNAKLCYGPRLAFEVLLDYLVKTCVRFYNSSHLNFFQFLWANSLFHDYLNHPRIGDELLHMTIEWLTSRNYLNNTMLILLSDHGIRWGSIRSTYQGGIEERLPMLYFIFPKWFQTKYSVAMDNMRTNRNRLTSPFDIHETLLDLLDLDSNLRNEILLQEVTEIKQPSTPRRGLSIFRQIPKSRTCSQAQIDDHWCVCHTMSPIPKKLHIVKEAARFIVFKVNQMILNYTASTSAFPSNDNSSSIDGNPCAKLKLSKIKSAMRKSEGHSFSHSLHNSNESYTTSENREDYYNDSILARDSNIELQITLVVQPSLALLEATVIKLRNVWKLSGEISRLNLYGEEGNCVHDPIIQKYCSCTDHRDKQINYDV